MKSHTVRHSVTSVLTISTLFLGLLSLIGSSPANATPLPGWNDATEITSTIPGFNTHSATMSGISCPSAGACVGVGTYTDGSGPLPYIIQQTNGVWGQPVRALSSLSGFGVNPTYLNAISCADTSDCLAVGGYEDGSHTQPFFIQENSGYWSTPVEVTSGGVFNSTYNTLYGVSCTAPGFCDVTGGYEVGLNTVPYVLAERGHSWASPQIISGGLPGFNAYGAQLDSVSCTSTGNCVAAGTYTNGSNLEALVVQEENGLWGQPQEVLGGGSFGAYDVYVGSISCGAAGSCVLVGQYSNGSFWNPYVAEEVNGVWGGATEVVSGLPDFNSNGSALYSVSCSSAGNCTAGGFYDDGAYWQPFTVEEINGNWEPAIQIVSSLSEFNSNGGTVIAISCFAPNNCVAGGTYNNAAGGQVFVIDQPPTYATPLLPVTNLNVTASSSAVTATFDAVSNASEYQCTLLYGYNNPSTFSEMTATNSCTFTGVGATGSYGIAVVALHPQSSFTASPSVFAFASNGTTSGTSHSHGGSPLNLPVRLYFSGTTNSLTPAIRASLEKLVSEIVSNNVHTLMVNGFREPGASSTKGLNASRERAAAVAKFLGNAFGRAGFQVAIRWSGHISTGGPEAKIHAGLVTISI